MDNIDKYGLMTIITMGPIVYTMTPQVFTLYLWFSGGLIITGILLNLVFHTPKKD